LKPEQWGSPLVQEKYQEEKACDKRHPYRIIIIIITTTTTITITTTTSYFPQPLYRKAKIVLKKFVRAPLSPGPFKIIRSSSYHIAQCKLHLPSYIN